MDFDVATARSRFPALAEGLVHLDGPGGTQVPDSVADAVATAMRSAVSNRHGYFASSERADSLVGQARSAVADLLGASPDGVILGPSMTTVTFGLSRALRRTWAPGDDIVVSRLDHDANIRPWVIAAREAEVEVRWAEVDGETGELDAEQYVDLVGPRTRLVAVTAASNALGTMPDIARIAAIAHEAGALVHVDGVHATPHLPVDMQAVGADFWACSSYKFFGPHLGMTAADPALLAELHPDKLVPSSDDVPDRFETGTSQLELLAGLTASVDYLASLSRGPGTRRARLVDAMTTIASYEAELMRLLLDGLEAAPAVSLVGRPRRRTPTVALTLAGSSPDEVAKSLGADGICVWSGDYYARELMQALGLAASGGAVRVGLVHYNTADEVRRLLGALAALSGGRMVST
ncbi:MAG TPA: cysteine desulfurase-like protein [Mycobacteriales bacterium]|nr:cysteine desulfurase-like protein [Mycobacteriales bacterium]